MFVVDMNNCSIRMHAGDTGTISYEITPSLGQGDYAIWTMRNSRGEIVKQNIMQITDSYASVQFSPEDTMNLDAGNYRYDIRVLVGAVNLEEILISDGGGFRFASVQEVDTPMEAVAVNIIGPVGKIEKDTDV